MLRRASFLFVAIVSSLAALAAPLFGPERAISPIIYAPPLGVQQPNGIASDGNGFLAVWDDGATERRGIYAALISPTGEIRPESQILIRRDAGFAFVAWNGESYSVFWNEGSASTLMLARVSRDGHLLDEPRALIDRANVAAVASTGTNVLVAYARDFGGSRDLRSRVHGEAQRDHDERIAVTGGGRRISGIGSDHDVADDVAGAIDRQRAPGSRAAEIPRVRHQHVRAVRRDGGDVRAIDQRARLIEQMAVARDARQHQRRRGPLIPKHRVRLAVPRHEREAGVAADQNLRLRAN